MGDNVLVLLREGGVLGLFPALSLILTGSLYLKEDYITSFERRNTILPLTNERLNS